VFIIKTKIENLDHSQYTFKLYCIEKKTIRIASECSSIEEEEYPQAESMLSWFKDLKTKYDIDVIDEILHIIY